MIPEGPFFRVNRDMASFFSWNVIWLHSRKRWIALFSWKLQNDNFYCYLKKRDLNRYCFSSFKKKKIGWTSQNKTTRTNTTVTTIWLIIIPTGNWIPFIFVSWGGYSWFAPDLTVAMLVYRTIPKMTSGDLILLFCKTWETFFQHVRLITWVQPKDFRLCEMWILDRKVSIKVISTGPGGDRHGW